MRRRAGRALLVYAVVVLILASLRAWQIHSAPFDCGDEYGHGPDPGTRECENAIARARARRSEETAGSFLAIVIMGGLALGTYRALRLTLRIGRVRRFLNDGDSR